MRFLPIKAAKVVVASRVNQSSLNRFSETITVDLKIKIIIRIIIVSPALKRTPSHSVYSANNNKLTLFHLNETKIVMKQR